MESQIKINDVFYPSLFNEDRYLVLWGGAGSGKSIFAGQKIITRCLNEPGHRFLGVRKVARTIRESVYQQLQGQISDCNLSAFVTQNKTEMSFTFPNGSEIITSGLDDPEKLKSIYGITGIWIEEATDLEKSDFDQLDLRLRGETKYYKQIMLSFNPISETHWIKAELFDKPIQNCSKLHTTYKDNSFIDDEYKQVLNERVASDENLYRIYVLGDWGRIRTGAEYYNTFNRAVHVKPCTFDKDLYLHCTFDQNVVPYYSGLTCQIEKEYSDTGVAVYVVSVLKEFALSNPKNKAEWVAREIVDSFPSLQGVFYYGDASGNKQDTRNNNTDYDIIRKVFKPYLSNTSDRTLRQNPPHKKRRQFIQALLAGRLPVRVQIDPACKLLVTDLESVKEDIDGGTLKEKAKNKETGQTYEKYGHLSDALCYFLIQAFRGMYDQFKYMG